MRILMVSDVYPPLIGGMERHVQTLSRALVQRGHHVAVATLRQPETAAFELDEGVRVHRLSGWSRLLSPFYEQRERRFHPTVADPGIMAGLRRLIADERPDIVHARGWMLYSYLPIARENGSGLVVTLHDYGLVCHKKTYVREGRSCTGASYRACVRCGIEQYGAAKSLALASGLYASSSRHGLVDCYIAISEAVRAASAPRLGDPPRPVEVIPTFIPDSALDGIDRMPRPSFLPPHDGYLLFVGALGRHKGLDVLLDAYRSLTGRIPLVIIGTERGDMPARFPEGVTVARNVAHAEVMAAWFRCGIGVVPSVWPEPFGQVAIEAMACGRPVVASDTGGLRDAVAHGETGLLVPPGDAQALRAVLHELLGDPARRMRMGAAGRERARLFMASTVVPRVEALYEDVLAAKRTP